MKIENHSVRRHTFCKTLMMQTILYIDPLKASSNSVVVSNVSHPNPRINIWREGRRKIQILEYMRLEISFVKGYDPLYSCQIT